MYLHMFLFDRPTFLLDIFFSKSSPQTYYKEMHVIFFFISITQFSPLFHKFQRQKWEFTFFGKSISELDNIFRNYSHEFGFELGTWILLNYWTTMLTIPGVGSQLCRFLTSICLAVVEKKHWRLLTIKCLMFCDIRVKKIVMKCSW